jgi:DNA invertase Pin-like site-specific DNA recombinase
MTKMPKIRCAIYTRKSSEEGLEQEFNSLDAQREACAAFVASQKGEGWILLADRYDDGGISGGTLERPALQRLLADIDAGKVDRIIVYKVDRLTRSLTDFSKLVERFDAAGCSFVSVTQSFNTATSMGRLTLNMLLSFAQFEREVTAERIRDKIAASKRKGLWMGGMSPLGYEADGRTLKNNEREAEIVRALFRLYLEIGCVRKVKEEADRLGLKTRRRVFKSGKVYGGVPFTRGRIYHLLSNPIYIGQIRHKGETHDGQHPAIIPNDIWDAVQEKLAENAARAKRRETAASPSPLAGKFVDETGDRLTPSHAVRRGRRHRYYVSHRLIARSGDADLDGWRLPAATLESAVLTLIRDLLSEAARLTRLVVEPTAAEIAALQNSAAQSVDAIGGPGGAKLLAEVVKEGRIAPGRISVILDRAALAEHLGVAPHRIDPDPLNLSSNFTLRRRGVEAKMVLEDAPPQIDQTLLRNVARGWAWLEEIKRGTPMQDIARRENLSQRRIARLADLAFLAPDIVEAIVTGRQPVTLTSDALIKSEHQSLWTAQRQKSRRFEHLQSPIQIPPKGQTEP